MRMSNVYYLKALQSFAYLLTLKGDKELANNLKKENDIEKLEFVINKCKEQVSEKVFFYNAGRICQYILNLSDHDGLNSEESCIYALSKFDALVGIS